MENKYIQPQALLTSISLPYKFQTTLNSEDIVIESTNTIEINAEDEPASEC